MKELRDLKDLTIRDVQPIGDAAASLRPIEVCLAPTDLVSQKLSIQVFGKSQFPHTSVNFSFIITCVKNKSTDLGGN